MTCNEAPACRALLTEATTRAPARRKTSDGICASAQHHEQNPGSDHEPHVVRDGEAWATGVDLSDDKAGGCDADDFAEQLRRRRDHRVKYVICNRRMFSSYAGTDGHTGRRFEPWEWRPYYGPNPHETHTHISIKPDAIYDTGPWWAADEEDPDMAFDDAAKADLTETLRLVRGMNHQITVPGVGLQKLLKLAGQPIEHLDPKALAAAIADDLGDDVAREVADELAQRLAG